MCAGTEQAMLLVVYFGGVTQEENLNTFEHAGMNETGFIFKNFSLKDVNLGFHL